MKVGMIGLGKLGLPVAVAMNRLGHSVMGYDKQISRMSRHRQSYIEAGPDGTGDFNEALSMSSINFGGVHEVCEFAEGSIIFVAVQTPHHAEFDGTHRLTESRTDFDYRYLRDAISNLAKNIKKETVVAIISTVLPGTIRREILPLCNKHMLIAYNPQFIAMGTTMRDFLKPEFALIGTESTIAEGMLERFYAFTPAPKRAMSIEAAELTKVAYNTFIGQKIIFVNTLMELCHHLGCNVDDVTDTLKLATDRLISTAYLSAGMGDGGGCHPRDGIAMSWLSNEHGLSYNLFDDIMKVREKQAEWLAGFAKGVGLPIWILGLAYKPQTSLTDGSSALLLLNILRENHSGIIRTHDPYITNARDFSREESALYFITTRHEVFKDYKFARGSVVIDPWGMMPKQKGVKVIHVGR